MTTAGFAARPGELWFGDDAAVLGPAPVSMDVLLCSDSAVAGVHADLRLLSPADLGWRAVAATLSDIAAMGGEPWRLVALVSSSPEVPVSEIMEGVIAAAQRFGCPVVGGDVTSSATPTVSIAAVGLAPRGEAVTRAGAHPNQAIFVTGPLGGSAAGLRELSDPHGAPDPSLEAAHRAPSPRLEEGGAARRAGASAMSDISDGLGLDLDRLARASGVGVALIDVPVAEGATRDEALGGGEDYELIIVTGDPEGLRRVFLEEGLALPIEIGTTVADPSIRTLRGEVLVASGYRHDVI